MRIDRRIREGQGAWLIGCRVSTLAFAVLWVAWIADANAQQVHTCIDRRGDRILQDRPCDAEQRELAVRTFAPVEIHHPASSDAAGTKGNAQTAHAARTGTSNARSPGHRKTARTGTTTCEAARDKRQSTLDRVGLKRTYDLLQRLDVAVQAACIRR